MITWDYRIFREPDGTLVFREVFYNDAGEIVACTEHAVEPFGATLEELQQCLANFQAAFQLPILTMDAIPPPTPRVEDMQSKITYSHEEVRQMLGLTEKESQCTKETSQHHRAILVQMSYMVY